MLRFTKNAAPRKDAAFFVRTGMCAPGSAPAPAHRQTKRAARKCTPAVRRRKRPVQPGALQGRPGDVFTRPQSHVLSAQVFVQHADQALCHTAVFFRYRGLAVGQTHVDHRGITALLRQLQPVMLTAEILAFAREDA